MPTRHKHLSHPVRHKPTSLWMRWARRIPKAVWVAGGLLVAAAYVWMFYYFFVSPYGFRWRALYGDASYHDDYEIHGIDISHHQGTINWEKLKNQALIEHAPIRFILIKATEGSDRVDPCFEDNFMQAQEYGFTRGAYHFYSQYSSPATQAQWYIEHVPLEAGDLPPVLDVEHKPAGKSKQQFVEDLLVWLDQVEEHYGVPPIIYTYYKFKLAYLDDPVFDRYPYWIAHYYVDKVEYKGEWKFWQHTDAGRLPGIKGYVDFNIYNGSYYDLRKMTIGARETIGEEAYSY